MPKKEINQEGSLGISETRSTNLSTIMSNRVRFSRTFSRAIQNTDFYDFVVAECMSSRLNDAEVLYAQIYNKQIGRLGMSVADYLVSTEISLIGANPHSTTFYHTACVSLDPLLGIVLMPGRLNDYTVIGQIPNSKNVYVDKIFEEFKPTDNISYSYDGTTSSHLYGDEPLDPYFAIKHNEQYIAYDINTEEIVYNEPLTLTSCEGYVRYQDVKSVDARIMTLDNTVIADKGYNSNTSGGTAGPRGGPEFIMQYAFGFNSTTPPSSSSPYGYTLANSARNNYILRGKENKWYYKNRKNTPHKNIQLLEWQIPTHSIDMQELWTEDDGKAREFSIGGTFKVKIPLIGETGVNLGAKSLWGGDVEIATIIVQYCDNWNDIYGYEYTIASPSGDLFMAQLDRGY